MGTLVSMVDKKLVKASFDICVLAKIIIDLFPDARESWEKFLFEYDPSEPDEDVEYPGVLEPVFTLYTNSALGISSMIAQKHPLRRHDSDASEPFVVDTLWLYVAHMWRQVESKVHVKAHIDKTFFDELQL